MERRYVVLHRDVGDPIVCGPFVDHTDEDLFVESLAVQDFPYSYSETVFAPEGTVPVWKPVSR